MASNKVFIDLRDKNNERKPFLLGIIGSKFHFKPSNGGMKLEFDVFQNHNKFTKIEVHCENQLDEPGLKNLIQPFGTIIFMTNVHHYSFAKCAEIKPGESGDQYYLALDADNTTVIEYLKGIRTNFNLQLDSSSTNDYEPLSSEEVFPDILEPEYQTEAHQQLKRICLFALKYRRHLFKLNCFTPQKSSLALQNIRQQLTPFDLKEGLPQVEDSETSSSSSSSDEDNTDFDESSTFGNPFIMHQAVEEN